MKHLGDITKISGYTAPVVDCIIGGSPCQDLSVAGRRAGLDGERSGLYIEQVRIVKEMRAQDVRNGRSGVDIRPRYMLWENVPGAFSSNKGDDFRIVLEELAKVCDENAVIPRPADGKWRTSGAIMGRGWSIAWRVLDAQFWGTSDKPLPQRRRRIALVADFGGYSAPEILFVRESLSGDIEPGEQKGEAASRNASAGAGVADCEGNGVIEAAGFKELNSAKARSDAYGYEVAPSLSANKHDASVCYSVDQGGGKSSVDVREGKAPTLTTTHDGAPAVVYALDRASFNQGKNAQYDFEVSTNGASSPLVAKGPSAVCYSPQTIALEGNGSRPSHRGDGYAVSDKSYTLNTAEVHAVCYSVENHPADSRVNIDESGKVQTLTSRMGTGGGNVPMVMQQCYSKSKRAQSATDNETWVESDTANTLNAFDVGDVRTTEVVCYSTNHGTFHTQVEEVICATLQASDYKDPPTACYAVDCRNGTEGSVNNTLQSNAAHSLNGNNVVRHRYIVRRLTPLECERLQGYPDGWTDIGEWIDSNGKKRQTSDAARYKALGNSIALPPWKWVLKRLCACYERDATMASLFDGIGGFPYLWEQLNGKGTCLWASDIEEFPMAVTKVRIGGE